MNKLSTTVCSLMFVSLSATSGFAQNNTSDSVTSSNVSGVDLSAADAPKFNIDMAAKSAVNVYFEERDIYRSGTVVGNNMVFAPRHAARRPDRPENLTIIDSNGTVYGRISGENEELDSVYVDAPNTSPAEGLRIAQSLPQRGEEVYIVYRSANLNVLAVPAVIGGQDRGSFSLRTTTPLSKTFTGAPVFDSCGFYIGTIYNPSSASEARRDGALGANVNAISARRISADRRVGIPFADQACPTRGVRMAAERLKVDLKKQDDAAAAAAIAAAKQKEEDEKKKKQDDAAAALAAEAAAAAEKKAKEEEAARKETEKKARARLSAAEREALEAKEAQEIEAEARAKAEALAKENEEKLLAEKENNIAVLAEEKQKKQNLMYLLGGGGIGLLVLLSLLSWFLVSRQKKARSMAEEDASRHRDHAQNLESKVPPKPYNDCLLYGAESIKLPGKQLPEATGGIILGRHPSHSQVVLDRQDVSRSHTRFFARNGEVHIEDLSSTNGTFVNGRRISEGERQIVQAGDMIRFGEHEFEFRKLS